MVRIQLVDLFVLAWFIACWAGYTLFARQKSRKTASLVVAMRLYRREWFKHVLQHENRIADVAAFNSLLTGATFFTSSSGLVVYILHQREFRSATLHALTQTTTFGRAVHVPAEARAASRLEPRYT